MKPPDPRFNYMSYEHKHWCDLLGTYANGVPKWRYSESKTAKRFADIVDGPEYHKIRYITHRYKRRVIIKGLSGKEYIVSGERDRNNRHKLIIEEQNEGTHEDCGTD